MFRSLLLLVLLAEAHGEQNPANATIRNARFVFGDNLKTSKDILDLWGYPYEQHRVLTEDGYVLTVDRIPNPGRPPVYMANPYLGSAPVYLNLGRDHALGFLLYDAGYDVWMSNLRGSLYAPGHIRLTTDDPEYWKFSVHEHAIFDHPACVDLVLLKTGYRQVRWVGFSMGSLTFLIMASLRPEYNRKIAAAFLMAPTAAQYFNTGNFMMVLNALTNTTEPVTERLGLYQLPIALIRGFGQTNCRGESRWLCNRLWLWLTNSPRTVDYIGSTYYFLETFPSSGSLRTTYHINQFAWAEDVFRPYVFSREKNLRLYGSPVPPNYPIERITTPTYTYTGDSDPLVTARDYRFVERRMRSIVRHWRHPDSRFCHADFTFSRTSLVLYQQIIRDMAGWT